MTIIKICGIKYEDTALAAAEAGADYIGMVFAASSRQVTPAEAEKITAALKKHKSKVKTVGVFVNERMTTVRKIADTCRLDWVQLSGDESWEYGAELARPLIKVIRVNAKNGTDEIAEQLASGKKQMADKKHLFLLDTIVSDKYGGTGVTFDWSLAKPAAKKYDVIIAGGLNPTNVGQAINQLKPWGVDVSTGVETRGTKDLKKITKFIEAVREADAK
jgi:phosphoribosylanthranilate isomerase